MSLGADVRRFVAAYRPADEHQRDAQRDFAAFFADDAGPVSREDGPHHATASALVFDAALTRTLLVFHGKGRFWVQPGGHLEIGDASIADAALRELREETGVAASVSAPVVHDLDHHALSGAFGRCASHLDIGVAIVVPGDEALTVSDESEDVRWWPVDALPVDAADGLTGRLERMLARLR